MPEPEPVPEPAPPPPGECRRRRRRSCSSASSRACRAQRRLHLEMGGGDGDGAGPAQKEAGRAHPGPRNPCLLGAPPADCGGRGAPAKGDPAKAPHATAPPREQARSGWRGPAPCQARREGDVGADPECFHWCTAGLAPPTGSIGSLPGARQRVIVTTRGFPGQQEWGGAQNTGPSLLLPPSEMPRPLILDP